ncbi:MAG: hypothetical protein SCH71_04350 [Desulfobulbaceae bacterium]|nr:hypothetical protein [Desulfobulbaceae bacterium]
MLITVTIGQLALLAIFGILIGVAIYFVYTLKNLRTVVRNSTMLINRDDHISQIGRHVEEVTSNAEAMKLILCGKYPSCATMSDVEVQGLLRDIKELRHSFRKISASTNKFRKTIRKLGR